MRSPSSPGAAGVPSPWARAQPAVYPAPLTGIPYLQTGITAGVGAPQLSPRHPLAIVQYAPTPRLSVRQVSTARGCALLLSDDGDLYEWAVSDDQTSRISDTACAMHEASTWSLRVPRLVHSLTLHRAITGARVVAVACGPQHALALLDDGVVMSWGSADDGRLGHGALSAVESSGLPTVVSHGKMDSAGHPMQPASFKPGCTSVYSSGVESSIQTPVLPAEPLEWRDLSRGATSQSPGGRGSSGNRRRSIALGVASEAAARAPSATECMPRPIAALSGKRVVGIAAGGAHSAAVTVEGEVWTWGRGRSGRLGHGDTKTQVTPKLVKGSGVVPGESESSAGLLSWLGFGGKKADAPDPDFVFDPLQFLPSPHDPHGCGSAGKWRGVRVLKVVCGRAFTLAITAQGEVWTWGSSSEGQCGVGLGQGPAADVTAPTLVSFPAPPGAPAVSYTVPLATGADDSTAAMSTTESGRPSLLARHGLAGNHSRTGSRASHEGVPQTPPRQANTSKGDTGDSAVGRRFGFASTLEDTLVLNTPSPGRRRAVAAAAAGAVGSPLESSFGRGRSSSAPDVGSFMDSTLALSPISMAVSSAATTPGGGAVRGGAADGTDGAATARGDTAQYLALLAAEGAAEREDSALDSPASASAARGQVPARTHRHAVRSRRHRRTFAVACAAGHGHSLVLALDGRVFAWGDNRQGQVGAGSKPWFQSTAPQSSESSRPPAVQPVPIEVDLGPVLQYGAPEDGCSPWDRVTGVTCGEYHSMALSWRGRVFAWGSNTSAELGVGHCESTRRIIEVGTTIPRKFAVSKTAGRGIPVPPPSKMLSAQHPGTALRRANTTALETVSDVSDAAEAAAPAEPSWRPPSGSAVAPRGGTGRSGSGGTARKRTTLWVGVRLIAAGKDFSIIIEGSQAHLPHFSKRARRNRSSSDGMTGSMRSLVGRQSQGDAALQAVAENIGIAATHGSAASDPGQLPYSLAMLSPVAAAQAMGDLDAGMSKLLQHSRPTRYGGTGRIRVNYGRAFPPELQEHQARYFAEEKRLVLDTRRWLRSVGDFAAQRQGQDLARMAAGGVHPTLRALVWPVAVGNSLRITPETFAAACVRAQAVLQSVVAAIPGSGSPAAQPPSLQASMQGSLFGAPPGRQAGGLGAAAAQYAAWAPVSQHQRGSSNTSAASRGLASAAHSTSAASLASLASESAGGMQSPDADSLPSIPSTVDLNALFAHELPDDVKAAVMDVVRQVAGHTTRPATPLSSAVSPLVRPFGKESSVQLIDVDLKRVYPTQRLYAIDDAPGPLHRHLALVLYAASVTRPDLGYVQGMAYVAGMLVAHISDPYIAYQTLLNMVTKEHLYAFLTMDRTLMARFYQVFFFILRAVDGHTHKIFESRCRDLHPDLYLLPWFQTMFTKILPFHVCARLWDMYVIEGLAVLVKAAIVLLRGVAKQLGSAGMEEMLAIMTSTKHRVWEQLTQEDSFFKEMESIVITVQQRSWLLSLCDDAFFYRGSDLAQIFSREMSEK